MSTIIIKIEENEEKYTDEQMELVICIYDKAKETAESIMQINDMPSVIKISKMIAEIIKLIEGVTIHKKISGMTKKHVAISLTRSLISKTADESLKESIITAYDSMADQMLETLIDVSRNVNIQEIATTCCAGIVNSLR